MNSYRWMLVSLWIFFASTCAGPAVPQNEPLPAPVERPPAAKAGPTAKPVDGPVRCLPSWVAESRWYDIHVPRFHNGERSNDPPGTLPWLGDWPPVGIESGKIADVSYGGDLQGVKARLGYLKDLGANTLLLTGCFESSSKSQPNPSVAPTVATGSSTDEADSAGDSASPAFSGNDRVMLDLIGEVHRNGMRVVLHAPFGSMENGQQETGLFSWTRRWMDPNGDGNPDDGPDGWAIGGDVHRPWPEPVFRRWTETVKQANKNALTLETVPPRMKKGDVAGDFDLRVAHGVAYELHRFFAPSVKPEGPSDLMELMRAMESHTTRENLNASVNALSPLHESRFMSSQPLTTGAPQKVAVDDLAAGFRLAMIVQQFMPGQPMTLYGDEVGMMGGEGALSNAPMWWPDLPGAAEKLSGYKSDFGSLLRWLHEQRATRVVLSEGTFRVVMHDADKQVLALARSLPGDDLILVVNYGKEKRKVMLPCGKPKVMIGVLIPNLGPPPLVKNAPQKPTGLTVSAPLLRVNGSRQISNTEGEIRLWLGPMSARLVVVKDAGPS
ncbi:MAG: hypothetical protein AABZ47_17360 [Planctomycetota bacterium]